MRGTPNRGVFLLGKLPGSLPGWTPRTRGSGGFGDGIREERTPSSRILPPHAHPGRISGPHKKGEGRAPARTVRGRGSGPAECETRTDKSLSHTSPPRRDPRRDRWAPVDSTGTRPPSSPTPRIGTSPSGWSRPHSVTRSSRSVHIQSTFSHFQSTFSHMWIHIQSTWGSTYVVSHARGHRGIYGVQRRMVETM